MNYNKPICIIPARSGSKRIKNKNIILINKKPLIAHTIRILKKTNIFSRIIVTTDSEKIKKISISEGAEVPFLRKNKLSGSKVTIQKTIQDCIKRLNSGNIKYHFCVFPTAILIEPNDLISAYNIIKKGNFNSVVAVTENKTFFRSFIKKKKIINFFWSKNSKKMSQELKSAYSDSGTFYIFKTSNYIKNNKILPSNSSVYLIDKYKGVNVDDQNDLKFLKIAFNMKRKK
jgi:CMP-N-acetylneuraminic acid synthetase